MCWCQPASSFTCEAGCCWAQASWWIWVLTFSPHLKLLLLDMDCTSPHLLYQRTYSYSTRMPFLDLIWCRFWHCAGHAAVIRLHPCSSHLMKHPEEIGSGCRCGSVETFCATLNTRCHQLPWAHLWWDGQLRMIKKGSWLMLRRRVTWFGLPSLETELWGPWTIMNRYLRNLLGMLFAAHCCPILCKFVNMFAASVCFSRSTMPMDVHDSFGDCLEARRIASATSLDVGIICQCQFMLPSCTNALSLCVRRPMKMWLRQHVAFWRTGFLSFASFIHLLVKRPRRRWT